MYLNNGKSATSLISRLDELEVMSNLNMINLRRFITNVSNKYSYNRTYQRFLCTEKNQSESEGKQGGFAKAFEKFDNLNVEPVAQSETFASLLRNSKFVDLGDPEGKVVQGRIFHTVEDDLYIDFGWKFHCVCPRPKKQASSYVRGAKVRLRIKDLEMSSKFLGYEKDLTLLEADCTLLGLIQDGSATKT